MTLRIRDRDYIESRLIAPCGQAMEAHERLVECGEGELARKLMAAMIEFTDKTRDIRVDIVYPERRRDVV